MANASDIGRQLMADLKRDFDLTDAQAAGVVGNMLHESASFGSMQEKSPQSGRGGYGYAQWTGPRRVAFESYVKSNDLDPDSYAANYGFLRHEVTTNPYERQQFNKVRQASTPAEAARIVSKEYLRPNRALAHNDRRIQLASNAMQLRSGPAGRPATKSAALATRTNGSALAAINSAAPAQGSPSAFGYAPSGQPMPSATPGAAAARRPPVQFPPMGTPDVASLYAGIYAEPKLTDLGAINASVGNASSAQVPALAAALARVTEPKAARAMPTRAVQSYAGQERAPPPARPVITAPSTRQAADVRTLRDANQAGTNAARSATVVASFPTTPVRLQAQPLAIPTTIGLAPTTRVVPSVPVRPSSFAGDPGTRASGQVVASIPTAVPRPAIAPISTPRSTNIASARNEQAIQRNVAPTAPRIAPVPTSPRAAPSANPFNVAPAPLPTSVQIAAATPFGKAPGLSDRLPQDQAALPTLHGSGGVAGVGTRGVAPLPVVRPPSFAPPVVKSLVTQVAVMPPMPIKRPAVQPVAVGTQLSVQPPAPPRAPVAPTISASSKPAMPVPKMAPIPFARPNFGQQPNIVAQMGQNLFANTISKPLGAIGFGLGNLAAGRPLLGTTMQQAAAWQKIPRLNIVQALLSQIAPAQRPSVPAPPRPPVGTIIGKAANGGNMIQGANGVQNSITQNSDAWKKATGQSSYGSGQSNDTRYESYF